MDAMTQAETESAGSDEVFNQQVVEPAIVEQDDIGKGDVVCYNASSKSPCESQKSITEEVEEVEEWVYDMYSKLKDVGLDEKKWVRKLREEAGIETVGALDYVGYETFLVLKSNACEDEIHSLEILFGFNEECDFDKYIIEKQKQRLENTHEEIGNTIEVMRKYEKEKRMRSDLQVRNAEVHCRGIFQIPEIAWLAVQLDISFVCGIIDVIHHQCKHTEITSFVNEAELLRSSDYIALTSILSTAPNVFSVGDMMFTSCKHLKLDYPVREQFTKKLRFRTRREEKVFINSLRFGNAFMDHPLECSSQMIPVMSDVSKPEYCSTLQVYVLPLAKAEFNLSQLQLSDEIMEHLQVLEKTIEVDNSKVCSSFNSFCLKYGSHFVIGPLHFGGIFIFKCYTQQRDGFNEMEAWSLHDDVISLQLNIHNIKLAFDDVKISYFDFLPKLIHYPEKLKEMTFANVSVIGGPKKVFGVVDWKHGLLQNKKTWHLLDRGASKIPIWEIIPQYPQYFNNPEKLATVLKCKWGGKKAIYHTLMCLGILDYFPQKLTLQHALEIRDDVFNEPTTAPYGLLILAKIMAFDERFRMAFRLDDENQEFKKEERKMDYLSSEESCPSESDDSDTVEENVKHKCLIHPMDCLVALLHCCDNILRYEIFHRMAACQVAVPLLLPDPISKEPVLLLWALKSIIKECHNMPSKSLNGRIITSVVPYVSFIRIGEHSKSKSHLLSRLMSKNHDVFLHYNFPGCATKANLINGLVDMSWYFPSGDKQVFPNATAFVNLHGDACNPDCKKQIDFLSNICLVHVVMLSNAKGLHEESTQNLFKTLMLAPGGVVIVQTETPSGKKSFQKRLNIPESWFSVVNFNKSIPEVCEKLQGKILKRITENMPSYTPAEIAKMCHVTIDEDEENCQSAKILSDELMEIIEDHKGNHPHESLINLLNRQSGTLWHAWAEHNKEQYRQERKDSYKHDSALDMRQSLTVYEYGEELRRKMKGIRQEQFENGMGAVMTKFVSSLNTIDDEYEMLYYLIWIKMRLDDLSREILPPHYENIEKKRKELERYQQQRNKAAEEKCNAELKDLDLKLINASFGSEHLLRELSQIYEAVIEQDPEAKKEMSKVILKFPQIAANLLFGGFPIELLDGDASHMPQTWIIAILESLSYILKERLPHVSDPRIFVLSVLGPQSTGKSTLLNALFGVRFSVCAGRCTRGAFMQLVPVHPSFQEEHGVNYFLLIDTEGLRAPERERLARFEHDNELATFVIGMANLTLITVSGTVVGDMDDILHTAVHAFLRMNQVQLKPRCHIVQQYVSASKENKQLRMDRFRIKRNLDKMTQVAAKQSGLEEQYAFFIDIIKFNYEEDVSLFPALWSGRPPMAHYSNDYVDEVEKLKKAILRCSSDTYSIDSLQAHLKGLWKAILQEDFVFSFKNTFEMAAYKNLEVHFGEWSWSFKKDMIEWEKAAQNSLLGCSSEKVKYVFDNLIAALPNEASKYYFMYKDKMDLFFKQKNNKITLQWEAMTQQRLTTLLESLKCNASLFCINLYESCKGRAEAENNKEMLSMLILRRVQELVRTLDRPEMTEDTIEKRFEESWKIWIDESMSTIQPLPKPQVKFEVEEAVRVFLKSQNLTKFVPDPFAKELLSSEQQFKLELREDHIKVICRPEGELENSFAKCKAEIQHYTNRLASKVNSYLQEKMKSGENFTPLIASELLRKVEKSIMEENVKLEVEVDVTFTHVYYIDVVLMVCGYAINIFEKMAQAFREKYDPFEFLERELKPYFRKMFGDHCKDIQREVTAAEALSAQLEKPIEECILSKVTLRIGDEMRKAFPWIQTKPSFLARILLNMGEMLQEDVNKAALKDCKLYLTNTRKSLQQWLLHFTEIYCNEGNPSRISIMIKEEIANVVKILLEKAQLVSSAPQMQRQMFSVSKWLDQFHSEVCKMFNLPQFGLSLIGEGQEFPDVSFFMSEFKKKVITLGCNLIEEYENKNYREVGITPTKNLLEQIAGCTAQCPFCKAQCEDTNAHHWSNIEGSTCRVKHQTQHRPQCLGNFHWFTDKTMMLHICSSLVSSCNTFRSKKTNQTFQPYKDYAIYYPDWNIAADRSLEASLYWKWLVGHYPREIEEMFKQAKTRIPREWAEIKWEDVKRWLKTEYKI